MPEDTRHLEAIETLMGKAIPRVEVEGIATAELVPADQLGRRRGRGAAAPKRGAGERPARAGRSGGAKAERAPRSEAKPAEAKLAPVESARPAPVEHVPSPPTAAVVALADRRPEPRHRAGRNNERSRERQPHHDDGEVATVAFGDHTPAFLLRPVKISSAS